MKFRVTFTDDIDLIIEADKEIEAIRKAKVFKDRLDITVTDSDALRDLAYKFAQLGSYFDRANSALSRNLLASEDQTKISEFYNLGLQVYKKLTSEIESINKAGEKVVGSSKDSDTSKLLSDGIDRLYWVGEPKCKLLAKKLEIAFKEFDYLTRRG